MELKKGEEMKKILSFFILFSSVFIFADETEVTTRLIIDGDPRSGVVHVFCIEGYKFALYRNQRTVTTNLKGYAGESQSSSMVQIINDRGNGIKCSKT